MNNPQDRAQRFKYVGRKRRTKEDRRFVTGAGKFVADVALPGVKHVALVKSPHPCARIVAINIERARALPGVHYVLTGAEIAEATNPLLQYLNTPAVHWFPLAVGRARYAGEWIAAVVADSRYIAEDAAELIEVRYEPLPFVIDPEAALDPASPPVHPDHGSNIIYQRKFTWGPVDDDFARAAHTLSFRTRWNRSSTLPIETFGVVAQWSPGVEILDIWASVQMPQYAEQIATALRMPLNQVRVHNDVDVGGSYGTKRGIKHTVLTAYLALRLGVPVRFIEDRLDNMNGSDMHGPDRIFDAQIAFGDDGVIRSMKLRAADDAGAYAGRAPLQLGKPVGAIVGAYRINSVEYEAISLTTNKTGQVAVRGFGQSPTNVALETAVERVAAFLNLDRVTVRERNFIRKSEFPYRIPSGSLYDSGDYHAVIHKALDLAHYPELLAHRDRLRAAGDLAGIGISTGLEPRGGNSAFESLLNPKHDTTTFLESVAVKIDRHGMVTAVINTTSSGQGHETLVSAIVGEELQRDPDTIRVLHADSLSGLFTHSPVGSRMAIMMGGAASGAARKLKERMLRIAAHNLGASLEKLRYENGDISVVGDTGRSLAWNDIVQIAHRLYHKMPPEMEPGLQANFVLEVPLGGTLPTAEGTVQMYPCYSFQAHVLLLAIDRGTCKPRILDYAIAHDCGTVINPDIVRGMIIGGTAHGIGAALYEKFEYDAGGQLLSQTFMDYLLPSVHEVPEIRVTEHCTPSPVTSLGQKGVGEGGYLGAPAAIVSAVNDALAPLGKTLDAVPMRIRDIWDTVHGTPP